MTIGKCKFEITKREANLASLQREYMEKKIQQLKEIGRLKAQYREFLLKELEEQFEKEIRKMKIGIHPLIGNILVVADSSLELVYPLTNFLARKADANVLGVIVDKSNFSDVENKHVDYIVVVDSLENLDFYSYINELKLNNSNLKVVFYSSRLILSLSIGTSFLEERTIFVNKVMY